MKRGNWTLYTKSMEILSNTSLFKIGANKGIETHVIVMYKTVWALISFKKDGIIVNLLIQCR